MKKYYPIGFLFLLFFDTLGQTGFKFSANFAEPVNYSFAWVMRILTNKWIYMTCISYLGAFLTWMILLKKVPVGPAFAASRLQIITVMFVSHYIFNEPPKLNHILGAMVILCGVFFLALAEKKLAKNKSKISG